MFSIYTQNLVYASEILSEISVFKNKNEFYLFEIRYQQNIKNYAMCIQSLNEGSIRHFVDVLFVLLPYLDHDKWPLFRYGG